MIKEKNFGVIISQINGNVATLTINRPEKLNSLPPDGLADLNQPFWMRMLTKR